ncbi:hypothetical protein BDQ12DRAFT_186234 [Crucibulum laeve]|uniref:Uncharacterized protein n=1 Tax=Crucibulum laeve TaxID=68775 RepID=A0A5C3MG13_9AGAR|nr:hypothetical protein BDQ12DRAFT_186234 [Crucibulum laeve]
MSSPQSFLAGFSTHMSAPEDVLVFADTHRTSRPSSVTYTNPVPLPAPIIKSMLFHPQTYELRYGIPMRDFSEGDHSGCQLYDLALDAPQAYKKGGSTRVMSFWLRVLLFLRSCKRAMIKFVSAKKQDVVFGAAQN